MRWAARLLLTTMLGLSPAAAGAEAFSCDGPFGPDASHAGLVKAFGATNVSHEEVFRGGNTLPMTVVFPRDPERRLMVHWRDDDGRRGLDFVIIRSPAWTVAGATVGMPIAVVERLNGRPFRLTDFLGGDHDGEVSDWQGGTLGATLPGGCRVAGVLGINDADADAAQGLAHPGGLASDDEALRGADPRLYELTVYFPKADRRTQTPGP